MRTTLRVASLATAIALIAARPAAGQQDVAPAGNSGCLVACALTTAACVAAVDMIGGPRDFCLGWSAGCIIGCGL